MREIPDCPLPFLALVRAHDGVEPSDEASANLSMEAVSTYEILEADARKEENELNPQMGFCLGPFCFAEPHFSRKTRASKIQKSRDFTLEEFLGAGWAPSGLQLIFG